MNEARKVGDLGNVVRLNVTSPNDEGYYSATQNTMIELEGPFSVLGRSVILHRNPDNCVRLEGSGGDTSAGERIGHCIIGLVSESCTGPADGCTQAPIADTNIDKTSNLVQSRRNSGTIGSASDSALVTRVAECHINPIGSEFCSFLSDWSMCTLLLFSCPQKT